MRITLEKNDLQRLVSLAEKSSSKNPTLPILSAVLLRASKNSLTITSTNLEVGFEANLSVKSSQAGEAAAPARTLLQLLSSMPDGELTVESSNHNLNLISQTSSTDLKCFPPDDFPVLPKVKKEHFFSIPPALLVSALAHVLPAASSSTSRPELASVFIFSQGKTPLTFTATDSFRLAEYKTGYPVDSVALLLPQRSAQEALRIFEGVGEDIEVSYTKNQILFASRNISFTSRLNEGSFPDYRGIVPKSFLTQVVLDRAHLSGAIRAASVFSSRLSDVILRISKGRDLLEVSARESDTGEHHSMAPAKISGEELEASFNYRYLLDALAAVSEPKVFLGFNGSGKAVLIKGQNESSYFQLVMPMRTV